MTKNPVLPDLVIGPAARHGAVTVLPVFPTRPLADLDLRLAGPAVSDGQLEICESPTRATVGMLEARNRGATRVLIVDGDHVLGAKQNRMLTSSVLVGIGRRVDVPASCVEQGRWQGPSERFAGIENMVPASLRRIAKQSVTSAVLGGGGRSADQQQIWTTIAVQQRRLQVSSTTRALAHTFAERAYEVGDVSARLPWSTGAVGLAIGVAGELISVDVFADPRTCAHYWQRLIEGAALEALSARQAQRTPLAPEHVQELLVRARGATWARVEPVGDGEEHRARFAVGTVEGTAAASWLGLGDRLVHLGVVTPAALQSPNNSMRRTDLPPELAEHYRITSRIGVGGTKEVFRAEVVAGGPDVAIARLPEVDPEAFVREIAAVRRVDSIYVPKIIEPFIDDDGDGYIVMEHCDGPNLAKLIGDGPLAVADAAPILTAFARGLSEIHATRVLHRDVKLENVMLAATPNGLALKILDFGLSARAACATTAVGQLRFGGTLPYMSREVLRGQELDARSDVYSFGVCCYRLLTGDYPAPPKDHESEWDYLNRLGQLERHDLSRVPPLPGPIATILPRMLDVDREMRPYMPEVVAAFEQAFRATPLQMPSARHTEGSRRPRCTLAAPIVIATPVAIPEHASVAPCMQAPITVLDPHENHTIISAFRANGSAAWTRRLDGRFTACLRADLDGDGMRELYLAGPGRFAVVGASGRFKHAKEVPTYATQPTLLAIADRDHPRLVIDGRLVDPKTGADLGLLPYCYQGNGSELLATDDRRGIAYNGFALQAFHGAYHTPAAILYHEGDDSFLVAHLEEASGVVPRIQLAVYGAGGFVRHALRVAEKQVSTGDSSALSRIRSSTLPLFGPASAPLVALRPDRTAIVMVPLLDAEPGIPPVIAAFELPSGRPLWRTELPRSGGRAILADVDGDGRPELVVGDGTQLVIYDPQTGGAGDPIPHRGLPIAFGDPFGSEHAHLITAGPDGVSVWRGPAWTPGTMQWAGARGDHWRTGCLRANGWPLGPR